MKKIFTLSAALIMAASPVFAESIIQFTTSSDVPDSIIIHSDVNLNNYWKSTDIRVKKVQSVAQRIMLANKIDKRITFNLNRNLNTVNASTATYTRSIDIYAGLLQYMSNDDELAFVIAHEIAHAVETYSSPFKFAAMRYNSKKYEMKADLMAIDYMVKAGYNPIAAITVANKIFDEAVFDWGFLYTHPKGSKRLAKIYKHIYVKYPKYLNSDMTSDSFFKTFENSMADEIKDIKMKEERRRNKNKGTAL